MDTDKKVLISIFVFIIVSIIIGISIKENFTFGGGVTATETNNVLTITGASDVNLGNQVTIGNWSISQDSDGNLIFKNGSNAPPFILDNKLNKPIFNGNWYDDCSASGVNGGGNGTQSSVTCSTELMKLSNNYGKDYIELHVYPFGGGNTGFYVNTSTGAWNANDARYTNANEFANPWSC